MKSDLWVIVDKFGNLEVLGEAELQTDSILDEFTTDIEKVEFSLKGGGVKGFNRPLLIACGGGSPLTRYELKLKNKILSFEAFRIVTHDEKKTAGLARDLPR